MSLFKDTYRVETTRLPDYDYSQEGAYYITICTSGRNHYFGEIIDDKMHLNHIGTLAKYCLMEIPEHFPFAKTDFFVIMPNHIHLILFINDSPVETRFIASKNDQSEKPTNPVETRFIASKNDQREEPTNPVETRFIASKQENCQSDRIQSTNNLQIPKHNPGGFAGKNNPMLNNNLSRIIRWYKGRTAYEFRKINTDLAWQPRFYEHIIRNETELFRVREYILNNPLKWSLDKYNIDI